MTAERTEAPAAAPGIVCRECRASLPVPSEGDLSCPNCGSAYPVVAGIVDLRRDYPDPYLTLEQDLAEARALAERFDELDFAGLLALHWRRSGKPPELVERFVAREAGGDARSNEYLKAIESRRGALGRQDRFLEVGCGAAGLALAAAGRAGSVVASDVSMRWLVLAKKRLEEAGVGNVLLVCSGAEDLPFEDETFDVVAASDVVEHVADQAAFTVGCARVLRSRGMLFLATPNRYSLGLEPHVRLWGVGLLPRRLARRYVVAVRKTPYDHVRLLSAWALARLLRANGFAEVELVVPEITPETERTYRGLERRLVHAYNAARRYRLARLGLRAVGPFFHVFATRGDA